MPAPTKADSDSGVSRIRSGPNSASSPRLAGDAHEAANGRGRSVPDRDALILQQAIPALRVEVGFVHEIRHAMQQRREDAIRSARHPAGIGGTPEDVVGVQIEHVFPRRVMREHRVMHMHRALWHARRAAREMQHRHILRVGRRNSERIAGLRHQLRQRAHIRARVIGCIGEQDVFQQRQPRAQSGNLLFVERARRHEHLRIAATHPLENRLRSKLREQRAEDARVLQRPQRREVQLRNPPEQGKHALAFFHTEGAQHIRKPRAAARQIRKREIADSALLPQPPQREMSRTRSRRMTIHRLVRDVQPATWQTTQLAPHRIP